MDNADPAPSSQLDRRARGRAHAFRFFATPRDAPRSRRPTDAVLLGLGLATLVAASWAAEPAGRLSNDLTRLVEDTPGWAQSAWQVFFDFMPFWAVVLVVRSVARRFFTLAASQVAAVLSSITVAYLSHRAAVADPVGLEDFVRGLTRSGDPTEIPAIRLACVTAVLVVASPGRSRPFRFFGRIVLALGFLATLGIPASTFAGAVGGLAAGAAAAAAVHLVFGCARPRRGGRDRGGAHGGSRGNRCRRADCARRRDHDASVHLLPATDLGLLRHALAPAEPVPLMSTGSPCRKRSRWSTSISSEPAVLLGRAAPGGRRSVRRHA